MYLLYTSSVLLHVLAASTWVGSMIFFAAAVVPLLRRPELASVRMELVRRIGGRFRVLGWSALGVLLVTGVSNLLLRGIGPSSWASSAFWATDLGRALAYKLAFVALALVSTALHDMFALRSRIVSAWLGRATLLFSLGAVTFAVWLVRGLP